jgi:DNA-binding NarL/FixJ family response regulator
LPITIAIADDQQAIRNAVRSKLSCMEDVRVIAEASNGEELLQALQSLGEGGLPDIALVDIEMPKMDGIQTIAVGSVQFPSIKFIVLTVFDNTEKIFEAIKAGASGYLLKNDDSVTLKEAITSVVEFNGVPMSPAIARKTLHLLKSGIAAEENKQANQILSTREQDVLKLLVEGLDYKEIAGDLFISAATVRTHIANIYEKLHVNSKAQAIKLAYKNKWI